jgi:DNA repair protein RecO (recombination protein O)
MRIRESEAFVLRNFKLAEADKIVVFLTRDYGVVRGVAKGARRLKSKFGAGLEPFTRVQLSFLEKEGRELVQVEQVEILHSFFKLARRDEAVAAFDYLSELALEFAPPHQPDEKFFRMICACFNAIEEDPSALQSVVNYFEIWTLKLTGFLPDVKRCGRCGAELSAGGASAPVHFNSDFSPRCNACRAGGDVALDAGLYALIRSSFSKTPKAWAEESVSHDGEVKRSLSRLTRGLIERHLERRPRGLGASGLAYTG